MEALIHQMIGMLGKMDGEMVEIRKLSERVRRLEIWSVLLMACLYLRH